MGAMVFGSYDLFSPESGLFYFAKSECNCVLIAILTIEMNSAHSKTSRAPKISKLDNFKRDHCGDRKHGVVEVEDFSMVKTHQILSQKYL